MLIVYNLCYTLLSPMSSIPTDRSHKYKYFYLLTTIISAVTSVICYSLMPIVDAGVTCNLYITNSSPAFVIVTLYCMQLPLALSIFIFIIIITHTSKRHRQRIADHKTAASSEPKTTKATAETTESLDVKSSSEVDNWCMTIFRRMFVHTSWLVLTRLVCIIVAHIYLASTDLITLVGVHITYVYIYLLSSSYPLYYVLSYKTFRISLWNALKIR